MDKKGIDKVAVGKFMGEMVSFNNAIKLYHWRVEGKGSYAEHIAIDQALDDMLDVTDRFVETTYAIYGDIDIVVPQTKIPDNFLQYVENFNKAVQDARGLFNASFTEGILDDYTEALVQMLYRVKRLS